MSRIHVTKLISQFSKKCVPERTFLRLGLSSMKVFQKKTHKINQNILL